MHRRRPGGGGGGSGGTVWIDVESARIEGAVLAPGGAGGSAASTHGANGGRGGAGAPGRIWCDVGDLDLAPEAVVDPPCGVPAAP